MSAERVDRIEHAIGALRAHMDDRFAQIDRRFEEIDQRFEQVDRRFAKVDQRFDETGGQLKSLFETLRDDVQLVAVHFTPPEQRVTAIETLFSPR
jgi:hypothetical protein